ncbi:MAG TPA: class F sortase [Candidatus Saccharimonadales bacterium]|nr:class F sortase [Candidatus Saccharimonadales bacterium]
MAKSTRSKTKKRQPAKNSRLSASSRAKKPSVKKTTSAKTKAKATKKPAIKKKSNTAKRTSKKQAKKLNIRITRRISLELTFKVNKKKTPARKSKKTKKSVKKDLAFEKNLILSTVFIASGIFGTVYSTGQIFGSPFGKNNNKLSAQSLLTAPAPTQEKDEFLPESEPTHLRVPAVDIDTKLTEAGKNKDQTLEVPENYDIAGWYKFGPTPGEQGPAVIAGHVNRDHGLGVFGSLHLVKKGQTVEVERKDGKTVLFKVDAVKQFPQDKDFPTEAVYGNIDHAGLRLITCAGDFNYITRRYDQNTVVFASYWKVKESTKS